jgi:tripartite-type tricarboxylate transporter receptor subunit TctC
MRSLSGFVALLALLVLGATPAAAQYPNKPIRLVVPFPPGGAADLAARVVAQPLAQGLGQPIIIENKAGADGAIAGEAVMKAAPDGYTLLFATNTGLCAAPTLRKKPPYDPIADFTPVSLVGKFGFFLFVHADVPAKTVPELLDYVRANPGKLNYGTGNSTSILATAQLAQLEKLDMVHVPYKGDAPLSIDLVAGRVQMVFATPGTSLAHAKEGKLRVLATLLPNRSALAPEVPTMAEAGLTKLSITPWAGLFGPAKLPREVVDRLAREMKAVIARPDVREQLGRYAFEGQSSSPEEMGAFLKEQLGVWRQTIKDTGIQPD